MKALIQKLPLSEDTSFVARIYRTPHFEVPWHQHAEFELILFLEGSGLSFAGNYVGDFKAGDIFFLGSNLPHTFQNDPSIITSAMVVQFKRDFCGDAFFDIAENQQLKNMLERSSTGFKIIDDTRNLLAPMVEALGTDQGFRRIVNLLECLNIISESKYLVPLSTQEAKESNVKDRERIDRIFQYTMDNFKEGIQLETIADVANMSVPAFCNYFKKRTKKTYIDFVNEIRIGYACQLLLNTEMSVMEACYESGYNTIANFNKQFIKTKGLTPTKYRTAVSCSKSRVFDADILNTSDIRGLQHVVADML